jgi:hypothetical protein
MRATRMFDTQIGRLRGAGPALSAEGIDRFPVATKGGVPAGNRSTFYRAKERAASGEADGSHVFLRRNQP